MPNKDDEARLLAEAHYRMEAGIKTIFRINGAAEVEARPNEPIKLLEVNEFTSPSGIMPLQFRAAPASGIHFPSVIVEVTPNEFEKIQNHEMPLPNGWSVGKPLPRPADVGAA
jgi:hypothetical protein